MSFQIHENYSRPEKDDLEGGRDLATVGNDGFLHTWYPYLFENELCPLWKVFGCCTLVGFVNVLSMCFTLTMTTNLKSSDIIIESNVLLILTGALVSLFWRLHVPRSESVEDNSHVRDELSSRIKSCMVGSLFTVMLSPALACPLVLPIYWLLGREIFSCDTPGVPLILSWISVNILAALLFPSLVPRRKFHGPDNSVERYLLLHEGMEDCNAYKTFDETDGPTFLPQQPMSTYHDIFGGFPREEMKACTFTPRVSWENTIETSDAFRELVDWAISVPAESLPPPVAAELLAMAAISIGVCLDGIDEWSQDVQHTYLVSRTCDQLAEIFQQADPSSIPEQALKVFLLVHRFERFDIDVAVLGPDNNYIPAEALEKMLHCLKLRSASLPGC